MLPRGIKERGSPTGTVPEPSVQGTHRPGGLGSSLWGQPSLAATPSVWGHCSPGRPPNRAELPREGQAEGPPGGTASPARASGQGLWVQGPAGPRAWAPLQPPGLGCSPFPAAKLTSTCVLSRPFPGWGGARPCPEQPPTRALLLEVPGQRWGVPGPAGLGSGQL